MFYSNNIKSEDVVLCIHSGEIDGYSDMNNVLKKGRAYRVLQLKGNPNFETCFLTLYGISDEWQFYPRRFIKLEDVCVGTLGEP